MKTYRKDDEPFKKKEEVDQQQQQHKKRLNSNKFAFVSLYESFTLLFK